MYFVAKILNFEKPLDSDKLNFLNTIIQRQPIFRADYELFLWSIRLDILVPPDLLKYLKYLPTPDYGHQKRYLRIGKKLTLF